MAVVAPIIPWDQWEAQNEEVPEGGIIDECASILLFGEIDLQRLHTVPDYMVLDGNSKVDRIREIRSELTKRTFSTDNRVVVIK